MPETQEAVSLEPCPWCREAKRLSVEPGSDQHSTFVMCMTCGGSGPSAWGHPDNTSHAIAAWNRRATPPARDGIPLATRSNAELNAAFKRYLSIVAKHSLGTEADAFREGWFAARALATPPQPQPSRQMGDDPEDFWDYGVGRGSVPIPADVAKRLEKTMGIVPQPSREEVLLSDILAWQAKVNDEADELAYLNGDSDKYPGDGWYDFDAICARIRSLSQPAAKEQS